LVIFASSQHFTGRPRLLINGLAQRNLFGVNVPLTVDRTIIENARSGGAALDCLITIVWPQAYQIALSILRDSGLAEDAAQEACVALARSLPSLKHADAFPAWCYKIIVSHAITAARHRPHTQALDTLNNEAVHFDFSEALDLYNALATLPDKQRGAVILHYYAGLNSGEIAAATGLPRSTVRFHLMLARNRLRKVLSTMDAGVVPSSPEALSDVH
jgi:RNA polymerase sigma-70 factor (ECF subfamily)